MTKINFDLSFLDEKEESNGSDNTNQQTSPSGSKSGAVIWGLIFAFIIAVVYFNFYEDWKVEKIRQLETTALQYRINKNPLLTDTLTKLASIKGESLTQIKNKVEASFVKKKTSDIDDFVDSYVENGAKDLLSEKKLIDVYYDGDKHLYDVDFATSFQKIKDSKLHKLIDIWKYNHNSFEERKGKYVKIFFDNDVNKFNQALDDILGYKNFTLVEKRLPKNGIMKNFTGKRAVAPFKISTSKNYSQTTDNYYIKLVDAKTKAVAVTIFVQSGSTVEVKVPLGVYKIRYAVGEKWYGEQDLFGHSTSYSKSEELLDFVDKGYYVQGHSLVLYKVANGNFSTQPMNANDF